MTSFTDPDPNALGVAGGAIAIALVDLLVKRGVISADDAREVFRLAQDEIDQVVGPLKGADASALIDKRASGPP